MQQRSTLSDKLKEVERQQEQNEITPELRQKLADIEREFNEVGRETARAFIPKTRVTSADNEASVYSSEAPHSPSKVSVPSRKQRNQQPSRVHDIKLATDISTSLLQQLRELQGALAEKDDALKAIDSDKARLEVEVGGLTQRLRAMNDSEQRFKDENWNLETQLRELQAAHKEATDREQRLTQGLTSTKSEKSALERDFEELKLAHGKLSDDHAAIKRHQESEISTLRRNVSGGESERSVLERKVEELTAQNQELAQGLAYRMRADEQAASRDISSEHDETAHDLHTPEHSPPPSPSKATPRHGQLESETLKSSLHHAHRMIQNLKNNIHREKTEKAELRRMLQDARDELESRRGDGAGLHSANKKRAAQKDKDGFKKPVRPDRLGAARDGRDEIIMDDPEWEEHDGEATPSRRGPIEAANVGKTRSAGPFATASSSAQPARDEFDTSTETEAFETADERHGTATESDAFQTGAETLDGDSSDDLTETENDARGRKPAQLIVKKSRNSYQSTASTEDEAEEIRTPVQAQPRFKLLNRSVGSVRQSTPRDNESVNTPTSMRDSPASFASSTSQPANGQSLFAELGDLSGGEDEESLAADTPSRSAVVSRNVSPEQFKKSALSNVESRGTPPKPQMVDTGIMTEPWHPKSILGNASDAVGAALAGAVGFGFGRSAHEGAAENKDVGQSSQPQTSGTPEEHLTNHAVTESANDIMHAPEVNQHGAGLLGRITGAVARTPDTSSTRQASEEPATAAGALEDNTHHASYRLSSISSQDTAPVEPETRGFLEPTPAFSNIFTQSTEPIHHFQSGDAQGKEIAAEPAVATLQLSPMLIVDDVEPHVPRTPEQKSPSTYAPLPHSIKAAPALALSEVFGQETSPVSRPSTAKRVAEPTAESGKPKNAPGFLGSVFGFGKSSKEPEIAEDETSQPVKHDMLGGARGVGDASADQAVENASNTARSARAPLAAIAGNVVQAEAGAENGEKFRKHVTLADEGTQTHLSTEEMDKLLTPKKPPAMVSQGVQNTSFTPTKAAPVPVSPRKSPKFVAVSDQVNPDMPAPLKVPRRPGSSGSIRQRARSPPPLPPDHKQQIAAAAQRAPTPVQQATPVQTSTPGTMGPPVMPASAYKSAQMRPRTPSVGRREVRDGTTPRAKAAMPQGGRADVASPISRRTSVSSFASELDQRFNIARNALPQSEHYQMPTDPRMIQAITQTMIGEYMWKYTRKAGREGMSENRHRRFFWVHPYTRTLYWSNSDPSAAGLAEMKAKSVPIEAVQVVTDDNPMPPGLHRKSLIVISPGRQIKFTAATSQRHETWFNALSYLLLRTTEERDDADLTAEDVAEFNPAAGPDRSMSRMSRMTARSRASLSSYNSRNTRNESPQRQSQAPTLAQRQSAAAQRAQSQRQQQNQDPIDRRQSTTPGSLSGRLSSFSEYFRPTSLSQRSRHSSTQSGIYDAPVVHDSAEDLRQVIEEQEKDADRLENVRACCDGMCPPTTLSQSY